MSSNKVIRTLTYYYEHVYKEYGVRLKSSIESKTYNNRVLKNAIRCFLVINMDIPVATIVNVEGFITNKSNKNYSSIHALIRSHFDGSRDKLHYQIYTEIVSDFSSSDVSINVWKFVVSYIRAVDVKQKDDLEIARTLDKMYKFSSQSIAIKPEN